MRTVYTTHPSPDTHARCNPQTHAHGDSPCPLGPIGVSRRWPAPAPACRAAPRRPYLTAGAVAGAALRASAIQPVTMPARHTQPATSYQKSLALALRSAPPTGLLCCAPRRAPPVESSGNTRSRHRLQRGWAASTRAGQLRRRTWLSPPKPDRLAGPCCSHAWEETPPYWHTPGAVT